MTKLNLRWWWYLLMALLIATFFYGASYSKADAPTGSYEIPPPPKPMSVEDQLRILLGELPENELKMAFATVKGESGFNPLAVGDYGTSYGLWQIHLPAHPSVTRECAQDVECSTKYVLSYWEAGHQMRCSTWSVYKRLFCG